MAGAAGPRTSLQALLVQRRSATPCPTTLPSARPVCSVVPTKWCIDSTATKPPPPTRYPVPGRPPPRPGMRNRPTGTPDPSIQNLSKPGICRPSASPVASRTQQGPTPPVGAGDALPSLDIRTRGDVVPVAPGCRPQINDPSRAPSRTAAPSWGVWRRAFPRDRRGYRDSDHQEQPYPGPRTASPNPVCGRCRSSTQRSQHQVSTGGVATGDDVGVQSAPNQHGRQDGTSKSCPNSATQTALFAALSRPSRTIRHRPHGGQAHPSR